MENHTGESCIVWYFGKYFYREKKTEWELGRILFPIPPLNTHTL